MLPILAVVIIVFILVGAYQIGSIFIYRDRAVVRDALDSACTSALASSTTVESHATNYSEVHLNDASGNRWDSRQTDTKYNIHLDTATAEATAKSTFQKIISTNNIKASLISWKFSADYDNARQINVTQSRTHTTLADSWWAYSSRNGNTSATFPRWVKVTITADVSVPILFGGTLGKSTQKFNWKSQAIKELTPASVF